MAADARDWIIPGRTRGTGHNAGDLIIRVRVAGRLGQDSWGRIKQKEPPPPDWSVRGKGAARSEGDRRPRPKWCSDGVMSEQSAKDHAMEMQ